MGTRQFFFLSQPYQYHVKTFGGLSAPLLARFSWSAIACLWLTLSKRRKVAIMKFWGRFFHKFKFMPVWWCLSPCFLRKHSRVYCKFMHAKVIPLVDVIDLRKPVLVCLFVLVVECNAKNRSVISVYYLALSILWRRHRLGSQSATLAPLVGRNWNTRSNLTLVLSFKREQVHYSDANSLWYFILSFSLWTYANYP